VVGTAFRLFPDGMRRARVVDAQAHRWRGYVGSLSSVVAASKLGRPYLRSLVPGRGASGGHSR